MSGEVMFWTKSPDRTGTVSDMCVCVFLCHYMFYTVSDQKRWVFNTLSDIMEGILFTYHKSNPLSRSSLT